MSEWTTNTTEGRKGEKKEGREGEHWKEREVMEILGEGIIGDSKGGDVNEGRLG